MLKKRLYESKRLLANQSSFIDLSNVMGGIFDENIEKQYETNLKNDIYQLEFLLKSLDELQEKNTKI